MQQKFLNSAITRSSITRKAATSPIVKNTCNLLAMTILFSAFTAFISTLIGAEMSPISFQFSALIASFATIPLMLLIHKCKNSAWSILIVFLLTGLLGYSLGPILNRVLHQYSNGSQILVASLALTGTIFLALSSYVSITRKNFNYLEGFLVIASCIILFVSFIPFIFNLPISMLLYSSAIVLLSCGWILFDINKIINGGEQNYVIATIQIYLDIFNLFISLLRILVIFTGKKD